LEAAATTVYGLLSSREARVGVAAPRTLHARAEAVKKLSRMLLTPVALEIRGKRLLIVSDGALQYIPFAALFSPQSGSEQEVPLITSHEIVELPSASTVSLLRRQASSRKIAPKGVVVLADPVFDSHDLRVRGASESPDTPVDSSGGGERFVLERSAHEVGAYRGGFLPRLLFSRREAQAISAAAPGDTTRVLDFDANKARVVNSGLKNYRIVHLATHGLLDSEHPDLSGLVFSLLDREGHEEDGFVRLHDIYNLELNADLVVLSACQTALGKQVDGEGLVGLARGFMYAGAPRVMASLWNVDDEATSDLMGKFYENLLKRHQTPAQALRTAQQWMRRQPRWRAAYYWAGFVLLGEWK
jgi:CHAT domain-containing protein